MKISDFEILAEKLSDDLTPEKFGTWDGAYRDQLTKHLPFGMGERSKGRIETRQTAKKIYRDWKRYSGQQGNLPATQANLLQFVKHVYKINVPAEEVFGAAAPAPGDDEAEKKRLAAQQRTDFEAKAADKRRTAQKTVSDQFQRSRTPAQSYPKTASQKRADFDAKAAEKRETAQKAVSDQFQRGRSGVPQKGAPEQTATAAQTGTPGQNADAAQNGTPEGGKTSGNNGTAKQAPQPPLFTDKNGKEVYVGDRIVLKATNASDSESGQIVGHISKNGTAKVKWDKSGVSAHEVNMLKATAVKEGRAYRSELVEADNPEELLAGKQLGSGLLSIARYLIRNDHVTIPKKRAWIKGTFSGNKKNSDQSQRSKSIGVDNRNGQQRSSTANPSYPSYASTPEQMRRDAEAVPREVLRVARSAANAEQLAKTLTTQRSPELTAAMAKIYADYVMQMRNKGHI